MNVKLRWSYDLPSRSYSSFLLMDNAVWHQRNPIKQTSSCTESLGTHTSKLGRNTGLILTCIICPKYGWTKEHRSILQIIFSRSLFCPVYTLASGNHQGWSIKQRFSDPKLSRGGKQIALSSTSIMKYTELLWKFCMVFMGYFYLFLKL